MLKNKTALELHTKFHTESAQLTFTNVKELVRPAASDAPWVVLRKTTADKHTRWSNSTVHRRTDDMVSDIEQ